MAKVPAIGIDLGTTNSCVGVFQNGNVKIIPNDQGRKTTPSYVAFTDSEILIGDSAKNQTVRNPTNTIFDAKRLIGRKFNDSVVKTDMKQWPFKVVKDVAVKTRPKLEVEFKGKTKTYFPEEISSMILKKMKAIADDYLRKSVTDAVITVPAYFNDSQRQATKDAATIAGLNVLRIINEPTAAAIAYGLEKKTSSARNVLIFDLGGGTFDVSILIIQDGVFEVKSTAGDTHLGGEDFDNEIVNHFVQEFKRKHKKDLTRNKRAMRRLRTACEQAKRTLSSVTTASIDIDSLYEDIDLYSSISRTQFNDLSADLYQKIIQIVEKTINDTEIKKTDIHDVVLVGGSSRIPKIQQLLQNFFGGKDLNKSIHPDEAVAYGAAIQAAILNGDKSKEVEDILLLDVTPLSLGSEVGKGKMEVVIKRNTTIPVRETRNFTTLFDSQTYMAVKVYEGEHTLTKFNNLLGEFYLTGIPPAPAGVAQIEDTFEIDANGILNVTSVEKSTGNENKISIAYNKGRLSDEEIQRMIKEAEEYDAKEQKLISAIGAWNSLKSYCLDMKSTVESENLKNKISKSDKMLILEKCNESISWLESDQPVEKEKIERKQKELDDVFSLIIAIASDPDAKVDKYYELLKVEKESSASEIEDAFRMVALKYHPDKIKGDKDLGNRMWIEISNAKNTLIDSVKRQKRLSKI